MPLAIVANGDDFVALNLQGQESICRIDPHYRHRWGIDGLKERFLRRVEIIHGTWFWRGSVGAGDYGLWHLNGRSISAHRCAFILFVGDVPDGKEIDHACMNERPPCPAGRLCVTPDDLEPVTRKVNLYRSPIYGANKTHCLRGHEYTPENTRRRLGGKYGLRACKECERQRERAHA